MTGAAKLKLPIAGVLRYCSVQIIEEFHNGNDHCVRPSRVRIVGSAVVRHAVRVVSQWTIRVDKVVVQIVRVECWEWIDQVWVVDSVVQGDKDHVVQIVAHWQIGSDGNVQIVQMVVRANARQY